MNMTLSNTIDTLHEKLTGDLLYVRNEIAYARRRPEKMNAYNGFSFISMNTLDSRTTELSFTYEGKTLLRVLLHNKEVSLYRFGLENYVQSTENTMKLFEKVTPELEELAFILS